MLAFMHGVLILGALIILLSSTVWIFFDYVIVNQPLGRVPSLNTLQN